MLLRFFKQPFLFFTIFLLSAYAQAGTSLAVQESETEARDCGIGELLRWKYVQANWPCSNEAGTGPFDFLKEYHSGKSVPYLREVVIPKKRINSKTRTIFFKVQKKSRNHLAKEVQRTYRVKDLEKDSEGNILLPVYGLYHNFSNKVLIKIDEPKYQFTKSIKTPPNESSPLNKLVVEKKIASATEKPSFDFVLMTNRYNGALIMDIDGEIRWQFPLDSHQAQSSFFDGKVLLFGIDHLYQIGLDWSVRAFEVKSDKYRNIDHHHEMGKGKLGYFVNVRGDRIADNQRILESLLIEVDAKGNLLKEWDLGEIIQEEMRENGDDPDLFVREGKDWFHMNSAIYSDSDDSVLVSSRENFVIKIDYETGKIKWILGDDKKYWYKFPSLRSLALSVKELFPVGQHSLSLVGNDPTKLMMVNNGRASGTQPPGEPSGRFFRKSKLVTYKIDERRKKASLFWKYEIGEYSAGQSSVYATNDTRHKVALLNTSTPSHRKGHFIILDKKSNVVFKVFLDNIANLWKARVLDNDSFFSGQFKPAKAYLRQ